jgi:hypothetical protein
LAALAAGGLFLFGAIINYPIAWGAGLFFDPTVTSTVASVGSNIMGFTSTATNLASNYAFGTPIVAGLDIYGKVTASLAALFFARKVIAVAQSKMG